MVIPRIHAIRMLEKYYLLILFEDETLKFYNAKRLFGFSIYKDLQNENYFHSGELSRDGSAVVWSDYLDCGAYEFWLNGITLDLKADEFTSVSLNRLLELQSSIRVVGLVRKKSESDLAIRKIQRMCDFLRQDLTFIYVSNQKIIEIFEQFRQEKAKKVYIYNVFSLVWVESELITLSILLQEEGIQFFDVAAKIMIDDDFFMYDSAIKKRLQADLGMGQG